MKMITGFLTPTRGTVKVNGFVYSSSRSKPKKAWGICRKEPRLWGDDAAEVFWCSSAKCAASWSGVAAPGGGDHGKGHLEGVAHQPIDTLSKGFKRRVGLAQAIVHDPAVLILDEPTDGLDPNQKHEVRGLIKTMAQEKAIILSRTYWKKSTRSVRCAMIIAKGKVITDGTPAELEARSRWHNAVLLRVRGPRPDGVQAMLQGVPGVKRAEVIDEGQAETGISDPAERRATDSSVRSAGACTGRDGTWSSCPWTGVTWMKCFAR